MTFLNRIAFEDPNDFEYDPRFSINTDLGRHLSEISKSVKFAVILNQIQRIAIRGICDRPEHGLSTMYVIDIYSQHTQKGLPISKARNIRLPKWCRIHTRTTERPDCQVEHRYSDFRALRERIYEAVDARDDEMHQMRCSYCNRMLWFITYGDFPSRYPNQGLLATYTGWRRLLTRSRRHKLEHFINELLTAVKDESYRHGKAQCEHFMMASQLLQAFLLKSSVTHCQEWESCNIE